MRVKTVGIEASRFLRDKRGIGRYVRALLPRIAGARPELSLVLFAEDARAASVIAAAVSEDAVLAGRVEVRPVSRLGASTADVFWYPWNFARPVPRRGAVVATVHDVAAFACPDPRWWRAWPRTLRLRSRYRATAKRATGIMCISSFIAREVHRYLGVPEDRIRVAHLAADDRSIADPNRDIAALQRLHVRTPYVLTVGASERRKNHGTLTRAMAAVAARHPSAHLVMAGPHGPVARDVPWLTTLGFVSEDDLTTLYRNAAALVVASTYEGFGLPVVEAMQLGAPLICASAASLPEVAGDAAEYFDAADDAQLADCIHRVLGDDVLRARMSEASHRRAQHFSWNHAARRTLEMFDAAATWYRQLTNA